MFARQRKARVLFGLSDIVLATLGFEAAYRTRSFPTLGEPFLPHPGTASPGSGLCAGGLGSDSRVGSKSTKSSIPAIRGVILRDTFRQCAYSASWPGAARIRPAPGIEPPIPAAFFLLHVGPAAAFPADRRPRGGDPAPRIRGAAPGADRGHGRTGPPAGERTGRLEPNTTCGCAAS